MSGFKVVNVLDMAHELSEDELKSILTNFSSPNKDVETFLKERALIFAKQGISQTHLVFTSYKKSNILCGYFTLANKEFVYKHNSRHKLSNTIFKKLKSYGHFDSKLKIIRVNAPLIGQIGKNFFEDEYRKLIKGDELLKIACDKIIEAQRIIGGKIVYLECEDISCLKDFYSDNGFVLFGERNLDLSEQSLFKGKTLLQMLRISKYS